MLSMRMWHRIEKRQAIKEGGLILTLESVAGDTLNNLSSANKTTTENQESQEEVNKIRCRI